MGKDGQQVADAGVDLRCRSSEGGVAVAVGVAGGRVGDALVDQSWLIDELGADLADLVAQADHVVEPAVGHRVQMPPHIRWRIL